MISRGPEGFGYWISEDSALGLAHRRLAIIDLSLGLSPAPLVEDPDRFYRSGEK
jgi:asparagine synthetase B (glutamine-hydrolysing)